MREMSSRWTGRRDAGRGRRFRFFGMALELLAGCGMISGAGFKISPDYPRFGELSPSKDYTLAILESLNLSVRKRV
jgi:hypothetical protein